MKIAVIADIHEDVISLGNILRTVEKERCHTVVCLGDIVGFDDTYYPFGETKNADECIRLVQQNCAVSVAGNHDLYAIRKIPSFSGNFSYPKQWYELDRRERFRLARKKLWTYSEQESLLTLSDRSREFISQLPEYQLLEFDGIRYLFSHFLFPDLSGSTTRMPYRFTQVWPHLRWMKSVNCRTAFSGHTHIEGTLSGTFCRLQHTQQDLFRIPHSRMWMTCPPVASGKVPGGFLILDTLSHQVSVVLNRKN